MEEQYMYNMALSWRLTSGDTPPVPRSPRTRLRQCLQVQARVDLSRCYVGAYINRAQITALLVSFSFSCISCLYCQLHSNSCTKCSLYRPVTIACISSSLSPASSSRLSSSPPSSLGLFSPSLAPYCSTLSLFRCTGASRFSMSCSKRNETLRGWAPY